MSESDFGQRRRAQDELSLEEEEKARLLACLSVSLIEVELELEEATCCRRSLAAFVARLAYAKLATRAL